MELMQKGWLEHTFPDDSDAPSESCLPHFG